LLIYLEINNPFANIMKKILLELPFSRKCESEADYIGLLLMAHACFDPNAAIVFWQRMSRVQQPLSSDFFSTHPSHSKRISNIKNWLPEAEQIFENSECVDQFIRFKSIFDR